METVPADVEKLIQGRPLIANLSTSVDDRPHVVPLWYRYFDGKIQFTTSGKKLKNARQNPQVAVAIERSVDGIPLWMVLLRGRARILDDEEEIKTVTRKIYSKYMGADDDEWADFYQQKATSPDDDRIIEVDVSSVVKHHSPGVDPDGFIDRQMMFDHRD
ncbi:pyridoxamine 5'-phosphate oxidase family protein [Halorientalis marina]|jgi:nitroimidazol reductase NimA-like FMN-containing flavoprotein (pyridoxamine 5'-phosphate oxidase superfamily)|uniref:pyridoxamine 5'-phosphate oxidase family protein n=1 Tax=Halorientalis marina TaxID=2931976 RepID=UPI001FF3589A|nr:pyridoxamine 5'-phosphate oxidase family protein [Halorientalis marina]